MTEIYGKQALLLQCVAVYIALNLVFVTVRNGNKGITNHYAATVYHINLGDVDDERPMNAHEHKARQKLVEVFHIHQRHYRLAPSGEIYFNIILHSLDVRDFVKRYFYQLILALDIEKHVAQKRLLLVGDGERLYYPVDGDNKPVIAYRLEQSSQRLLLYTHRLHNGRRLW